jgi:hypothetical protein
MNSMKNKNLKGDATLDATSGGCLSIIGLA